MRLFSALRFFSPSPALWAATALATLTVTARAQTIYVADQNGTNGVRSYTINGTLINNSAVPGDGFQGLALSGSTLYIADASSGSASIRTATLNGTGGVASTGFFTIGGTANGLTSPMGLAVTGSNLYITNINTGNVFRYDLGSGLQTGTISTNTTIGGNSFITSPYGVAVSGNTLFVSAGTTGNGANTINGYNLTTFSATPTITITSNLNLPFGLAVSGNTLFVANGGGGAGGGSITTFDATTGASTGTLVSGLTGPQALAVYGSSLFVTGSDGTVKGFNTSNGSPLAGFTTITGLSNPNGIAVGAMSAIPEPSTYAAIAGAAMLGLGIWHRRRSRAAA